MTMGVPGGGAMTDIGHNNLSSDPESWQVAVLYAGTCVRATELMIAKRAWAQLSWQTCSWSLHHLT